MRRMNENLYPKDGYFFKESDGTKITGRSWKSVIKRVRDYRARNRMNEGNPENEVYAQACARNPGHCYDARRQNPVQVQMPLKARVLQWLNSMKDLFERKVLPGYVGDEEWKERAKICASCPANKPIGTDSCSTCKAAIAAYRTKILGARPVDSRLGGCEIRFCDLPTAVHLDETRVDNPQLPPHCWHRVQK